MNEPPRQPFTLAVFTKNRVNPAYDAARLAVDRIAAEAGARTGLRQRSINAQRAPVQHTQPLTDS